MFGEEMTTAKQTVFTDAEAYAATLEYFNGDDLATSVWLSKYALRDADGNLLERTPTDMHHRLAKEFARIEQKYPNPLSEKEIFSYLNSWQIVPQGSPMAGIGNPYQLQSLSNCFVLKSCSDSFGSILRTDEEQCQIMKRRGGVGHDISNIRPRGAFTNNAAKTTDGISAFMERFSTSCRTTAQGGRRGALMLTIDVSHAELEEFIEIKRDRTKITGANISIKLTDEFMDAVATDQDFVLQWPVNVPIEQAKITKTVKARVLWMKMISAAHDNAEPGLLFWGNVLKYGPADIYPEFKSIATNPCLTGDTKVAVADGRGYVTIKELTDANVDVPVYACDDQGKIVIKMMRHPRLTGYKQPVYKIVVEGGHSFRATGNHKFPLINGKTKTVAELISGDQFMISKRVARRLVEFVKSPRNSNSKNNYIVLENSTHQISEHKLIWETANKTKVPNKHVIHHVDFNSLNNAIENLRLMTTDDHVELHAAVIRGDKNPMRCAKNEWSEEKWQDYRNKQSAANRGLMNRNSYAVSNEDLYQKIKNLTSQLGRIIGKTDWHIFAQQHNIPIFLTDFRTNGENLFVKAARELGIREELITNDPRLVKRWIKAEAQGYICRVENNNLEVGRICEWCSSSFWSNYDQREFSFCSNSCGQFHANRKQNKNVKRAKSIRDAWSNKAEITKRKQLDVYTALRFDLKRNPVFAEWDNACKEQKIVRRLGTTLGFKNFNELNEAAKLHNHRVVSVEFDGYEDVYNGTVDDHHNFYIGGWNIGNNEQLQILTKNCGEVPLSAFDSCRLLLVNLDKFVANRFSQQTTSKARFEFDKFKHAVEIAQRLMDDLVDLEIECIDKIIQKIENDPEDDDIKSTELNLWKDIKNSAVRGRRTGLGITGLGDVFAGLDVVYGSDESIKLTEDIYKTLSLAAYNSSVTLAAERGAFPAQDLALENGHVFLSRLFAADTDLATRHAQYGRRNIAITTTPPAGSVSILTQTTSGIEPVFMLSYTRRKKINPNDKDAKVDFVDAMGDKWTHFEVYHKGVKKWMDMNLGVSIEKSPYFGSEANNIDWKKRVELQAAAQKWVCHSISSTINLPRDVSVETVAEIYMLAYKLGLKGITVYRDGSRDGVLVNTADIKQSQDSVSIQEVHAPKRPKELVCDIHRVIARGDTYLVFVGLLEDKPYEIFAGLNDKIDIPKKCSQGKLVKIGKKDGTAIYNLIIPIGDDELVFKDILNLFDNNLYGVFTRMISLSLRHGISPKFIAEQIKKDKHSDMTSFSNCIARVLSKNYIADGTKVTLDKQCQECKQDSLVYENGCSVCKNCGFSKC